MAPPTLCFQCYRIDLYLQRAPSVSSRLSTSGERAQTALPFERVDVARLERLRAERAAARADAADGAGRFAERRRRAQIAARRALQDVATEARVRLEPTGDRESALGRVAAFSSAAHAAELQLPEAWLPFVVGR